MKRAIFFMLAAALLLTEAALYAKTITPGVSIREEYNDNLLLTESGAEDDFITTITPNLAVEYSPGKMLDLKLDYSLNFRFYSRHDEFNDTSLKDSQNIDFQAHAAPLSRVFIDVADTYRRVPVDIRERFAADNLLVNMTENNIFSVSPYTVLPIGRAVAATMGYQYQNIWYRAEEDTDSESHSAFLTLSRKILTNLSGELRYKYYIYLPESEVAGIIEEYNSHRASVFAAYEVTPDFVIKGEVGRAEFDYEATDDLGRTFWNINTDYRFRITKDASMTLGYGTSFEDSPIDGTYRHRRADISLTAGKVLTLTLRPYYLEDEFLQIDRKDRAAGVTAGLTRPLTSVMDIAVDGEWERQKFSPGDEKVVRYGAAGRINYRLTRNISAELGYRYSNRDSDIETEDFVNNIAWLQAKAAF
ncbi:MAG: TIGR03016 family PEP-CTERM system-associated outer membrane protein [Nitrospirae bacterium]|nr:TIGR03016 family PEP-CTERM system-associated outer membrane protein [Nitrospirota bacterium]